LPLRKSFTGQFLDAVQHLPVPWATSAMALTEYAVSFQLS
jgi:hypothetical protein